MALRIWLTGLIVVEGERGSIGEATLVGPQGRLVFAMLAAEHRRVVTRDEIAEELWGDALPSAWEGAIRVLVTKLRRALERIASSDDELIVSETAGYRLNLPPHSAIDLETAAEAVHLAEVELAAGRIEQAGAAALTASMISARPLLPGADGSWATATRGRLCDVRIRALSCLSEVWMARGDAAQAARDAAAAPGPGRPRSAGD